MTRDTLCIHVSILIKAWSGCECFTAISHLHSDWRRPLGTCRFPLHFTSSQLRAGFICHLVFFENMAESIWAFLERNSRSRYSVYLLSNGSFEEVYRTEISWHLISAPVFLPLLSGRTENLPWRKSISKLFPLH